MSTPRAIWAIARADFLERVRRYSFLVTLLFAVYLGYAAATGRISLRLVRLLSRLVHFRVDRGDSLARNNHVCFACWLLHRQKRGRSRSSDRCRPDSGFGASLPKFLPLGKIHQ